MLFSSGIHWKNGITKTKGKDTILQDILKPLEVIEKVLGSLAERSLKAIAKGSANTPIMLAVNTFPDQILK